jgi:tripartite-type tricarboxylate transporter receptor subunit TctC
MKIKIKDISIYSFRHSAKQLLKSVLCFVAVFSTVASVGIMSAQAQTASNYPTKPIRLIVPVAAGGNVDLVARAVAEPLSKALGQQVIVENRPGASSLVGTMMVANAPADGYTLLAHSTTFVTAPLLLANDSYCQARKGL